MVIHRLLFPEKWTRKGGTDQMYSWDGMSYRRLKTGLPTSQPRRNRARLMWYRSIGLWVDIPRKPSENRQSTKTKRFPTFALRTNYIVISIGCQKKRAGAKQRPPFTLCHPVPQKGSVYSASPSASGWRWPSSRSTIKSPILCSPTISSCSTTSSVLFSSSTCSSTNH